MAIISLPAGYQFDRVDWHPVPTVQVNRAAYSKGRRTFDLDNGYFVAAVEIQVATENEDRGWRVFNSLLRGPANTFRLPATDCQQTVITGTAIQVAADAAAGAVSMSTKNWANASVLLKAGQYITVNDQLLMLTADVPGSGTNRTIAFDPPLRAAAATNTTVTADYPTALVFIPGGEVPKTADGVMTWAFQAEEAF